MHEAALIAQQVTYEVRGHTLLSAVDFAAAPGELVAVIGPNGAGKSTLLNLLAGNLTPSSGRVLLDGDDLAQHVAKDLALARSILTQRELTNIPFTASQVVAMGRFPHRRVADNTSERDAEVIGEAMAQTDTAQYADRVFTTLSKGEQTRVSLARVIAQETPVILLDEPTTALDVAHQERIMERALHLAHQPKTVVVVLHDLNAAAHYADRLVLLDSGRIAASGDPSAVLDADLLSRVYAQPMVVTDHPFRECPLVLTADQQPPR